MPMKQSRALLWLDVIAVIGIISIDNLLTLSTELRRSLGRSNRMRTAASLD